MKKASRYTKSAVHTIKPPSNPRPRVIIDPPIWPGPEHDAWISASSLQKANPIRAEDEFSIDRVKTAILVMDYQKRQLSSFSEEFQREILRKANEVLENARRKGIHVIYILEEIDGERAPEIEIHPAIRPKTGDIVLTKHSLGPFSTTNLDEVLKKQGINTLVLMGISTSGCVLSMVRCAADIDYKLIVLSDCCADKDDEVQRVLMEKLFPRQASVINSQHFVRTLGKYS